MSPLAKDVIQATLHYQIARRVQNNVMDLSHPCECNTLLINVDATNSYQCTQIPRQIKKELITKIFQIHG